MTLKIMGRLASCRSHLEELLALYDPISHRSLVDQAGIHPRNNAQSSLATVLLALGYPDQALTQSNAAIVEARRLAHPSSLAATLALRTLLLSLAGDDAALGEFADELYAVADEQNYPVWRAQGMIYRG
jgi:adenylate cyclase